MFDTQTVYLERLGSWCDSYRLEKVLRHDQIRTSYQAVDADDNFFEIQLFEESQYGSDAVHESINSYIESLRQISIANTVAIIDSGYTKEDEPYLVTERLHSEDLSSVLAHSRVVDLGHSLLIAIQVSQVLSDLHVKGIFHGCLSPRSLYLEQNSVVVDDVGIGYIASLANRSKLDRVGIPLYMSPEQLGGEPPNAASDTYALALILYECITGLPPHSSGTVTELALQRRRKPPSLSAATDASQPPEIEAFFRKALSNKINERFPDAEELRDALLSVQRRKPQAPTYDRSKIPHRYNILRHPSTTNLTELQRIDVVASQSEVQADKRRSKVVQVLFSLSAIVAIALYAMTLTCLASMHQQLGEITNALPEPLATASGDTNSSFVSNPPKLEHGELSGETKLDSVMKFCTGYGLRADKCVGDFSKIAGMTKLEYLSATDTAMSDAELKSFAKLPLRSLDIANCDNITSAGFKAVQQIPTLRYLRVEKLPLMPEDLNDLNPNLNGLHLRSCSLNDESVDKISRLKNLTELDLSRNQLSRDSFKFLRTMPSLFFLDLQDNPKLTKDDVIELSRLMPSTAIRFKFSTPINKSLFENVPLGKLVKHCNGIDLNAQGSNGNFAEITKFPELQELDLSRSTARDKDLRGFSKLPLRYVGLGSCRIGSGALKELQKLPNLISIDAPGSGVRDEDLAFLNANLKSLDLSSCNITDGGVAHLARMKNLVKLNLHNNAISPDAFKVFKSLKSLRQLDIHDCANIRIGQAKALEDSMPGTVVMMDRIKH